ncbi:MAG: Tetratricopeptide repeat-containing protein [Mucilaginibacter sp.]|nr:Tetratricopeptide repeat-containing protein [Mucilaginibacter sp.]
MYKHLFLICAYLLVTCLASFSQRRIVNLSQKTYTEFKKESKNLKNDTNKVLIYLKYAQQLEGFSPDTVVAITKTARTLSYKLNYPRGVERSFLQDGAHAESEKNYPLAIRFYKDAIKIAETHKLYADVYAIYNSALNAYYYQADYANAMDIAQKGLSLAEQLGDKENQGHFDNQAGFIYLKQEKADAGIKYYTRYLALANEMHNRMMVADASNGIADGYLLKNDYQTALKYFFTAFGIYDKMNEMEPLDRQRMVFRPDRVPYTLFKISTAYKQAGNYKLALRYALAVFAPHSKKGNIFNNYDLASYYINAGDIYSSLKDYKQAGLYLNKGLLLAKSILHYEDIRDAYRGISKNFALQHQYDSAYHYQLVFTGLKDSIINEKVNREINKLEVERRDKEIVLLNERQKLKETETARQSLIRNVIIGFVTFVACILILLLYIQGGIKQQKLNFEKQLAVQTERQRISSDMHDDIGTGLSTMLIYVNMLKLKLADSRDGPNIDRIAALGTELVEQLKEIVWSLNPGNDRLDNLLLFIRQYFVLLFEPLAYQTNIIYPLTIPEIEIDNELRRNIFLCVKELLNNIIKHADASCVELNVHIDRKTLLIRVKDNGKGFIPDTGPKTGNGLKNIRQRMNAVKGKFSIQSSKGTVIKLEIHLPNYPNR